MGCYYIPRIAELHPRFNDGDGLVKAFSCSFDYADGVGVGCCAGADVVCFVEVPVVALVVEGYVDIDDVSILEGALVRDAVTDCFVDGGTNGFRKVAVVKWGWVGLLDRNKKG